LAHVPNGWCWTHAGYDLTVVANGPSLTITVLHTGQANHFRLFAGARSEYGINRYIGETKRLYKVLESRLKESPYLAGPKYTIADIANYSWVRSAPVALEIDLAEWPALKKWKEKIEKRDAVQKGVDVPKRDITPEQMADNFQKARARINGMTKSDQH
jgi:glutathione S-transferase